MFCHYMLTIQVPIQIQLPFNRQYDPNIKTQENAAIKASKVVKQCVLLRLQGEKLNNTVNLIANVKPFQYLLFHVQTLLIFICMT